MCSAVWVFFYGLLRNLGCVWNSDGKLGILILFLEDFADPLKRGKNPSNTVLSVFLLGGWVKT